MTLNFVHWTFKLLWMKASVCNIEREVKRRTAHWRLENQKVWPYNLARCRSITLRGYRCSVWLICNGRDIAWLDLIFTTIPPHMYLIMFRHKALIIRGIDSDGKKRGRSPHHLQQPHCEMCELWAISHFISRTLPNTPCAQTRSRTHKTRCFSSHAWFILSPFFWN